MRYHEIWVPGNDHIYLLLKNEISLRSSEDLKKNLGPGEQAKTYIEKLKKKIFNDSFSRIM